MIQHFYANNVNSLCCKRREIASRVAALSDEDLNEIKKLPSIEKHMERLKTDENKEPLAQNNFKVVQLYGSTVNANGGGSW